MLYSVFPSVVYFIHSISKSVWLMGDFTILSPRAASMFSGAHIGRGLRAGGDLVPGVI